MAAEVIGLKRFPARWVMKLSLSARPIIPADGE